MFQSIFGEAGAASWWSERRAEGSTVKMSRLVELGAEGKIEVIANPLPSIFTIVIDGKPILVFEAKNLRTMAEVRPC